MTSKRSNTRLAAVKALYANKINDKTDSSKTPGELAVDIIEFYFQMDGKNKNLDQKFLIDLITGVCENEEILNEKIKQNLNQNWKLERLDNVLLSILQTGVFELLNFEETPFKVIINEYVEIARGFFDDKETGFVNGLLDKVSKEARG